MCYDINVFATFLMKKRLEQEGIFLQKKIDFKNCLKCIKGKMNKKEN